MHVNENALQVYIKYHVNENAMVYILNTKQAKCNTCKLKQMAATEKWRNPN